jgi:amino acid transporter
MERSTLNLSIDGFAFAGFVLLTTTGVLLRYVLPPGSGHYSTIWGLDRHEWGGIHFWIAVVFFSVLGFICCCTGVGSSVSSLASRVKDPAFGLDWV